MAAYSDFNGWLDPPSKTQNWSQPPLSAGGGDRDHHLWDCLKETYPSHLLLITPCTTHIHICTHTQGILSTVTKLETAWIFIKLVFQFSCQPISFLLSATNIACHFEPPQNSIFLKMWNFFKRHNYVFVWTENSTFWKWCHSPTSYLTQRCSSSHPASFRHELHTLFPVQFPGSVTNRSGIVTAVFWVICWVAMRIKIILVPCL